MSGEKMSIENVFREVPYPNRHMLPSDLVFNKSKNLRSIPDTETLRDSVLLCGMERPILVLMDKFGKPHIKDGVTKTLLALEVMQGKHLKPDDTPYTLKDIKWKVEICPESFESYDEALLGKAKLRCNLNTPNSKSDIGNFVINILAEKISQNTYHIPYNTILNKKQKNEVKKAAIKDLASDGTFSESYIKTAVGLAIKQGLRLDDDPEVEEVINTGAFKDSNILSQLRKLLKEMRISPERKEILNIIGNRDFPDYITPTDIRYSLENLRQRYNLKRFPLKDYPNEFRKRLPIQHTLKNKTIPNMPKELIDAISKYAKNNNKTTSEVTIEILSDFFNLKL